MRTSLLALIPILAIIGCGPARPPVPPGEIPPVAYVSPMDEEYGQQVLSALMREFPLERDDSAINRVRDIVDRLTTAAGATREPWHVYVLKGDSVINAAATRGNYVFVWTGMLRLARSDGQLAAVLAHEIGHVLAAHTSPTPQEETASIMAQVTGEVAGRIVAVQGPYGPLGQLAGILAQEMVEAIIVNPESQRKEFEADHIGIFLMADAGYNPDDAITLWTTMSQVGGPDGGMLSFFSSHPANEERLEELHALLPAAHERYKTAVQLGSRPKKGSKRRSTFDSFAIGHSDPTPTRRPVKENEWTVDQSSPSP
jgi:predicted Zn-dependent protease